LLVDDEGIPRYERELESFGLARGQVNNVIGVICLVHGGFNEANHTSSACDDKASLSIEFI